MSKYFFISQGKGLVAMGSTEGKGRLSYSPYSVLQSEEEGGVNTPSHLSREEKCDLKRRAAGLRKKREKKKKSISTPKKMGV